MKGKRIVWLLGTSLLLGGCAQVQDVIKQLPLPASVEEVVTREPEPDPVIGTKTYGTLPGRMILDYAPLPVEENGQEGEGQGQSTDGQEATSAGGSDELTQEENTEVSSDESTQGGDDEATEDRDVEEQAPVEEKPLKTSWTREEIEEILTPHDTPMDQLSQVGDYLIDYHDQGRWVREALLKDGDRYNHPMVEAKIPEELVVMARGYFSYLTKMNDALAGEHAFDNQELDLTLCYSYQYENTDNYIFYYREYMPKSLLTTGNEGFVVLDKNGKLVHYLSFGRRNPVVLSFTPAYDQETAEKRLWKLFNNRLHGYVDDYVLTDLYLKIPANGDLDRAPKSLRPKWHAEFRSPLHSHTQTLIDPGK